MSDVCSGTCIMEGRISRLESRQDEQEQQYSNSRTENAERMTRMEGSLDKVLCKVEEMNTMLSESLKKQHSDEIEKARNSNGAAASKWNNLSVEARSIIKSIFLLVVGAVITILFKKFG